MTTLISLISRQTLPNVIFIKQMGPYDKHIFITSHQMEKEGRSEDIIRSLKLDNVTLIVIDPEDIHVCLEQLQKSTIDRTDTVTVHITGGTKMTALAAFSYFTENHYNAHIYYSPIGKGVIQCIYPKKEEIALTKKVNLLEYLTSYGVHVVESSKVVCQGTEVKLANLLFDKIAAGNTPIEIVKAASSSYKKDDKNFIAGGWFEIWTACYLKQFFNLSDNEIAYNVKLTRSEDKGNEYTEYDVVYVRNNKLYIVECKYFYSGFKKKKIKSDWYKLGGLRLYMGLSTISYFMTANTIDKKIKMDLDKTKGLFNIKGIVDMTILSNKEKLSNYLNNI